MVCNRVVLQNNTEREDMKLFISKIRLLITVTLERFDLYLIDV